MTLQQPGTYRAIADFTTSGKRYVLGVDLRAPGNSSARALPPVRPTSSVDGYTVRFGSTKIMAGEEARLVFAVSRDGKAVQNLQPYLGTIGHLVALRNPDHGRSRGDVPDHRRDHHGRGRRVAAPRALAAVAAATAEAAATTNDRPACPRERARQRRPHGSPGLPALMRSRAAAPPAAPDRAQSNR
jgi:hypothetical protein